METSRKIRKAVFPVAGLGARFLPATKAMPKELLPILDKPIIQFAVEEAVAAGITDLIFVTGRTKRAIEDHFDGNPELEKTLLKKGKTNLVKMVRDIIPDPCRCKLHFRAPGRGVGIGARGFVRRAGCGSRAIRGVVSRRFHVGCSETYGRACTPL